VAIAGSAIHLLFVGVAYIVLLRGDEPRPLLVMVKDFAPAVVSSLGLIGVAVPLVRVLDGIGAPVPLLMAAVAVLGGIAYLVVLRVAFPRSARDLGSVVRRLLPSRVIPARFGPLAPAGS
jgi:hypothetical protein